MGEWLLRIDGLMDDGWLDRWDGLGMGWVDSTHYSSNTVLNTHIIAPIYKV